MLTEFAHITAVDTGHVRVSQKGEVRPDVIRLLKPIVQAGGGPIPPDNRFNLHAVTILEDNQFSDWFILYDNAPCAFCLFSWSADGNPNVYQSTILDMIKQFNIQTTRTVLAAEGPYLSVLLLPGLQILPNSREIAAMLGDFERCVAWTVVDFLGL